MKKRKIFYFFCFILFIFSFTFTFYLSPSPSFPLCRALFILLLIYNLFAIVCLFLVSFFSIFVSFFQSYLMNMHAAMQSIFFVFNKLWLSSVLPFCLFLIQNGFHIPSHFTLLFQIFKTILFQLQSREIIRFKIYL